MRWTMGYGAPMDLTCDEAWIPAGLHAYTCYGRFQGAAASLQFPLNAES